MVVLLVALSFCIELDSLEYLGAVEDGVYVHKDSLEEPLPPEDHVIIDFIIFIWFAYIGFVLIQVRKGLNQDVFSIE